MTRILTLPNGSCSQYYNNGFDSQAEDFLGCSFTSPSGAFLSAFRNVYCYLLVLIPKSRKAQFSALIILVGSTKVNWPGLDQQKNLILNVSFVKSIPKDLGSITHEPHWQDKGYRDSISWIPFITVEGILPSIRSLGQHLLFRHRLHFIVYECDRSAILFKKTFFKQCFLIELCQG